VKDSAESLRVGYVGVGTMGAPMAHAVLRAGIPTTVFDVRSEAVVDLVAAGAAKADSVEQLCKSVDVVCVVVVDERQVQSVADVVAESGGAKTLVIHSTVTPAFVASLAERLSGVGIDVVDASVAGGVGRARTGDLTVMVGGDGAAVARVAPVFDAIGREIFHGGPAGAGAALKLAVNFTTMASYELHLEATQLGAAYGLPEDLLMTVLSTSNADSRGVHTWGFHDRVRRNAAPGTAPTADLFYKDLSSTVRAAAERGVILPIAATAAATVHAKLAERDAFLDSLGEVADVPRCATCGVELAAPFRAAGKHPECA
jgi:3-hydroxyisobutyrate dehydrogenase-like beta-hydroxyacid dehydrogenase